MEKITQNLILIKLVIFVQIHRQILSIFVVSSDPFRSANQDTLYAKEIYFCKISVTPEQIERTTSQKGSIKVISTKEGIQKEVSYSSLDKVAQEEVLTDLLVKSAVHYAMKKQQVRFCITDLTSKLSITALL